MIVWRAIRFLALQNTLEFFFSDAYNVSTGEGQTLYLHVFSLVVESGHCHSGLTNVACSVFGIVW